MSLRELFLGITRHESKDQERALNLSILILSGPGEFPCTSSLYVFCILFKGVSFEIGRPHINETAKAWLKELRSHHGR